MGPGLPGQTHQNLALPLCANDQGPGRTSPPARPAVGAAAEAGSCSARPAPTVNIRLTRGEPRRRPLAWARAAGCVERAALRAKSLGASPGSTPALRGQPLP